MPTIFESKEKIKACEKTKTFWKEKKNNSKEEENQNFQKEKTNKENN